MARLTILFAFIFWTALGPGQAGEPPKVLATGEWSKPIAANRGRALRGRHVLCEQPRGDDRRHVAVYVELQDASEAIGESMRLYCDMGKHDFRPEYKGGLNCDLRDQHKQLVKPTPFPFGGGVPKSEWVTLPADGTIRIRATPFGISRVKAKPISPHLGKLWVIADDDPNEYFLSGTFTINPPLDTAFANDEYVWRGTIELPAMRIGK